MHDLIKLTQQTLNDEVVNTVNARELHEFLENGDKYTTWIKDRIEKYNFLENKDFLSFLEKSEKGGRPKIEYHISLDMAKELAMVERNEKGRQARRYFIECEKQLQARTLPQTYSQALRELADSWDREQLLIEENKAMKPKAEYFDDLVDRNLLTHGSIYRDNKNKLRPYSQHTPELFELKEFRRGRYTNIQTLITPKGRETFRLLIV